MDSDPNLLSPTNDKFGARFNKKRAEERATTEQILSSDPVVSPPLPQEAFGNIRDSVVSPPLPQETFGATVIRRGSERQNPYDSLLSPKSDTYNPGLSRSPSDIRYVTPETPETPYDPPYDHESPYDPPDGREVQIPMHQMDEPYSATTASPMTYKKGDYGFVSQRNDSDTRSLLSVAKKYDHRDSRKFLIKTGSYRFSITLLFCVLIALSLKAYEGFGTQRILNKTEVRVFNSLMLGLSLGLGLNLASSLKRYAVILRWSLLTKRYVSLEVFDLILGLETLTKVGKLMVISLPFIRKLKFARKWPWFKDARDDGTRLTWLVCLIWIFINVGAQILVAALSLFWPVDPSDAIPMLTYGNVSVSDLTKWYVDPKDIDWNASSLQAAWSYGNEATNYPVFLLSDSQTDLSSLPGTPMYHDDGGYYEYRFLNRNPGHLYTNYMVSTRKVQAKATCVQIETRGQSGKDDDGHLYIMAKGEDDADFREYYLTQVTVGSLSWMGDKWEHCGPRCTNFTVFQQSDEEQISQPSLFQCTNTLSAILGGEKDFDNLSDGDKTHLYSNDEFARIAAGAIAWTGYQYSNVGSWQTRSYLRGSDWSPYPTISKKQVEDLIARYTIGAIAAFDDHGERYEVQNQWKRPVQGQQLQVDWVWVLSLLGAICFIQLVALVLLVTFANKSIIRDESFFSLAMLLSPVMNRIGKEGMNLSGEEIKNHPKLRYKRIRYDYREGKNGEPNQVDIFFQGKDMSESRRSWAPGVYS